MLSKHNITNIARFNDFYWFNKPIETGLVTSFSVYKIITLSPNGMLYVLNHDFRFFANRNKYSYIL